MFIDSMNRIEFIREIHEHISLEMYAVQHGMDLDRF